MHIDWDISRTPEPRSWLRRVRDWMAGHKATPTPLCHSNHYIKEHFTDAER